MADEDVGCGSSQAAVGANLGRRPV